MTGFNYRTQEPRSTTGEVIDVRKDWDTAPFTIYIKTESDERISVGGFGAYLENIAADKISIFN